MAATAIRLTLKVRIEASCLTRWSVDRWFAWTNLCIFCACPPRSRNPRPQADLRLHENARLSRRMTPACRISRTGQGTRCRVRAP